MKTKMEMAHEWYLKHSESTSFMYAEVKQAWEYADAMQVEADKRKPSRLSEDLKEEEWQPDWTQAPEWANWWAMDSDKKAYYFKSKPYLGSSIWLMKNVCEYDSSLAPAHNYQGDWKDSLRERPE